MDYMSNNLLNTDSYKTSHAWQYPPGTEAMYSYIESRGGLYPKTVFVGLQYIIKAFLLKPITVTQVKQAARLYKLHGVPFPYDGWMHIVEKHGGLIPVRIWAVKEGMVIPTHNVLMAIESTDPVVFWVVSWIETMLMRIWYPITVATQSFEIKKILRNALDVTSDRLAEELPFKLHDFGFRGVSSYESGCIGGMAHLTNFMGTDTVGALALILDYYLGNLGEDYMPGYSIPAAEHSTITSWGRENEVKAYENMLLQFGKPQSIVAIVSDSYDIFNACSKLWGDTLKQKVIDSQAVVVIRPDSGIPWEVVPHVVQILDSKFGSKANSKGYKVLNNVRVIQGDGVNSESIQKILTACQLMGFSAENLAFGMGGALLQKVDRDTQKFAMKCSAVKINGVWKPVFKDPITDQGKKSKPGRVTLMRSRLTGEYYNVDIDAKMDSEFYPVLELVYDNGKLLREQNFEEIRKLTSQV